VIGLEGADPSQLGPELPPVLSGRPAGTNEIVALPRPEQPPAAVPKQPASLLIDRPVRSDSRSSSGRGCERARLVGSGARSWQAARFTFMGRCAGRAMAGHMGNPRARIFCQKIEAELLAINGYYRTAEEIDAGLRGRPMQAWLNDNVMMIRS